MTAALAPKTNHLAWVDAMRGIAILMVIAVHVGHGLKGYVSALSGVFAYGGYGVQLFFVASAFTLCVSMGREYGTPHWLKKYAIRRYFRIAPMYYLGILFYFAWSFAKNQVKEGVFAPEPQYGVFNVLANLFFFHGFVPSAYNNIVPGGWSIAVETSFYLVFPLVFALYKAFQHHRFILTAALLTGCWLLAFGLQQATGRDARFDDYLYFNVANQMQVFVVAIAGYMVYERVRQLPAGVVLALMCVAFYLASRILVLDVFNAKFYGLAVLAVGFFLLGVWWAKIGWSNRFLEEIGRRSFSMYILHFFLLNVIEYLFNVRWLLLANLPLFKALLHFGVAVWGVYLLSGFTKKHIEDRFIAWGSKLSKTVSV